MTTRDPGASDVLTHGFVFRPLATALRAGVVLVLAWGLVFLVGSQTTLGTIDGHTWVFLILSGLATGASWLCYFRALQLGDVTKVVPVDKTSTVVTMVLAITFLGERVDAFVAGGMVAIGLGTYLMIELRAPAARAEQGRGSWSWLAYAGGSALFAALTAILGKVGIEGVESTLGTAIRTGVTISASIRRDRSLIGWMSPKPVVVIEIMVK